MFGNYVILTNLNHEEKIFPECQCNPHGSANLTCDRLTGKCDCKNDFIAEDHCDKCIDGYYGFEQNLCGGMKYGSCK